MSLYSWTAFEAVMPPKKKQSMPWLAQVLRLRSVVGRLGVDATGVGQLVVVVLGRQLDVGRQPLAEDLVVVQDADGGASVLVHDLGQRGALDGVLRHDPRVVALAGRVVDVRLADVGVGAGLVGGEADGRVARRDHRQARLVVDRDRDRRGAGVEGAEIGDRRVVLGGALRVRRLGLRRPRAAWAVESSSGSKLMFTPPALLPASLSASSIPFWIASPVGREAPWSGRLV